MREECPEECPECRTVAILRPEDCDLIDWALGVLSSDYNDVPHDDIAALRERIRISKP